MRNLKYFSFVSVIIVLVFGSFIAYNKQEVEQPVAEFEFNLPDLGFWEEERLDGGYYTIVDTEGNVLDKTIRKVYLDDEFIASNNRHYRVIEVIEDKAFAELLHENALSHLNENHLDEIIPVGTGKTKNLIALYHTHTAESYVPSDGKESIPGNGGIYKVGEKLAKKLEEKKVNVDYDKTPHDPHDADAYRRSRRTAVELMKKRPSAIIDVHRDGVPDPDFYYSNVSGVDVTKIRLVVGRQNQNMEANLDFAKHIKNQLDRIYPGLIHGIFMAKGNYNQDLSPRSLLIEVGTHTNKREIAEKGAELFADGIPVVLGIATPTTPKETPPPAPNKGGFGKSIWILIGIALVGIIGFLLLSTGSVKNSISKLKEFSSEEWSNFLGYPHEKEKKESKAKEEPPKKG